jgi:hypothetical protein
MLLNCEMGWALVSRWRRPSSLFVANRQKVSARFASMRVPINQRCPSERA